MPAVYEAAKVSFEEKLLNALSLDAPWALIERFTSLVRESGSEDERIAAQYISDQLKAFGVPHEVYTPDLFLSVPVKSRLVVGGKSYARKAPPSRPIPGRAASQAHWYPFPAWFLLAAWICST